MSDEAGASELYDLTIQHPSQPSTWRRFLAIAMANVVAQNVVMHDIGGRHAIFTKRDTGERVGEFKEPMGADATSVFNVVLSDYATLPATEFQRLWLPDQRSA